MALVSVSNFCFFLSFVLSFVLSFFLSFFLSFHLFFSSSSLSSFLRRADRQTEIGTKRQRHGDRDSQAEKDGVKQTCVQTDA